jgi:hypothetical protein
MPSKVFDSERHFEKHVERLIETGITHRYPDVYILHAKKTVDIVICKDRPHAQVYFLELKYFNKDKNHSMMAFGSREGSGFQPAVLQRRPPFFRRNLRWVMGCATDQRLFFLTMDQARRHLSGGAIGKKQNGFRRSLFEKERGLSSDEFVAAVKTWLRLG